MKPRPKSPRGRKMAAINKTVKKNEDEALVSDTALGLETDDFDDNVMSTTVAECQESSQDASLDVTVGNHGDTNYMQQGQLSPVTNACDESVDDNTNGVYYFETDHCALRGNKDYHKLLKTLAILESQRVQAINDLEKLIEAEETALLDPLEFVQKLQNGENLGLPMRLNIPGIPKIPWEEYTNCSEEFNMSLPHVTTRGKRVNLDGLKPSSASTAGCSATVVRGRAKTDQKPKSFNKLWSAEEQKRLEELLIQYPPEEVEANRFKKIATALGNRTQLQVASRIQKYFVKLYNAGLPVPGKLPSKLTIQHNTAKNVHRHQKHNRLYWKPSTFMQSYEPPVYMSDDDDDDSFSHIKPKPTSKHEDMVISDDESISVEHRNSEEYLEIMRLKKLKKKKLDEEKNHGGNNMAQHLGYKCDRCEVEPILGTRWRCTDCPMDCSVDLCDECYQGSFETVTHHATHRMKSVHIATTTAYFMDRDYTKLANPAGYNYLDPNYMPAT